MSSTAVAFVPLKEAVVAHTDTCSGKVIRVLFRAEETGFSVLAVEGEHRERQVIKGICPPVGDGIVVAANGRWIDDRKFGRQLEADLIRVIEPTTADGILAFLSSGLIDGIGPELARRIVEQFGDKTIEVLEGESVRLSEVRGIGAKRLAGGPAVKSFREMPTASTTLARCGCAKASAGKATVGSRASKASKATAPIADLPVPASPITRTIRLDSSLRSTSDSSSARGKGRLVPICRRARRATTAEYS
jgi:ATP-dependent exoDNAse (exonuclease V) alpha subunit